jgi:hypothetical protein
MTPANHRERQVMQYLRVGGWVKAASMPSSPKVIGDLLSKAWIDQRGTGSDLCYRITAKGLAAKMLPVRIYT